VLRLFKRCCDKIRFCGDKYLLEPRYKLFYISPDGEYILGCRAPKNIIQIEMHRPGGYDIYGSNVIGLSEGDFFKVTVHNYYVHPRMSILERACAISTRYICYEGDGKFAERIFKGYWQDDETPYITIYSVD